MRQWIIIAFFINTCASLQAQYNNPKEYVFLDYASSSIGSNPTASISLNYITKTHFHFEIGVVVIKRAPDNLPDGYSGGILGGHRINTAIVYSAFFGKILYNSAGGTRFRLSGGPGIATVSTPFNFTKISSSSVLGRGVSHEFETSNSTHLVFSLQPTIDFVMGSGIGFSFKFNTSYIPNFAYVFNMMLSMSIGKVYLKRSQRDNYTSRSN